MPLLEDDKDSGQEEPYEFEEGQEAVAKLVHLVYHPKNIDLYFEILLKFKRVFVKGGVKRLKYTCPALIFALFRLSMEIVARQSGAVPYQEVEEVKGDPDDEDELPVKLTKVDQVRIFKLVTELIGLIKS